MRKYVYNRLCSHGTVHHAARCPVKEVVRTSKSMIENAVSRLGDAGEEGEAVMYDAIIIGSGPAGLAAAIYGKRACLDILVLEKHPMSGGQILNTYEVDNYPGLPGLSGMELGEKLRDHAERMEVSFSLEEVTGIEKSGTGYLVLTNSGRYESRAVILAMGADHRKLLVPGEEELRGMGVSYCATCDGAFFRDKITAVVGGGDVALEDALFLARICKKVYLIHRRDELRGAGVLQERVRRADNIEILWNTQVEEILGEDMVRAVRLYDKKKDSRSELLVNGIFVAVGITPNSRLAQGLVELDEKGYIRAGEDCAASLPGIFAAGDIRTKQLRQVITAASDGANAIASTEAYLNHL